MATLTLTLDNDHPAHGDTVTATYTVGGNDGAPARPVTVSGTASIDCQEFTASGVVTLPGTDPLPESFDAPVCDGLTFVATDDPAVWTALVP